MNEIAEQLHALAFLGPIGWKEIVVVLLIVLLLFGGKKLPELAGSLARGLRGFKEEMKGVSNDIEEEKPPAEEKQDTDQTEQHPPPEEDQT